MTQPAMYQPMNSGIEVTECVSESIVIDLFGL